MRIIKRSTLAAYWSRHPDAERPLKQWLEVARAARWRSILAVRVTFPHADAATVESGNTVTVFNIGGNDFRLVVSIKYKWGVIYIRDFLTHAQYSKNAWKNGIDSETKAMASAIGKFPEIDPDYLHLVRRFPLVPIRNGRHLKQAFAVLDTLSVIDEEKLSKGQSDYLAVLSDLLERYEDVHFALEDTFDDGIEALKYLLAQHGMSASDLGRVLGNRQIGAAILRRSRQLSKANVMKLAAHFNVTADLLLRENQIRSRRAS